MSNEKKSKEMASRIVSKIITSFYTTLENLQKSNTD